MVHSGGGGVSELLEALRLGRILSQPVCRRWAGVAWASMICLLVRWGPLCWGSSWGQNACPSPPPSTLPELSALRANPESKEIEVP